MSVIIRKASANRVPTALECTRKRCRNPRAEGLNASGLPYHLCEAHIDTLKANLGVAHASRVETPAPAPASKVEHVAVEPIPAATGLGDIVAMMQRLLDQQVRIVARIEALENKRPATPASASRTASDTAPVKEAKRGKDADVDVAGNLVTMLGNLVDARKKAYVEYAISMLSRNETPMHPADYPACADFSPELMAKFVKSLTHKGMKLEA